nr:invasion associated locus B family protein [uncultured Cohaesibacter sp.]
MFIFRFKKASAALALLAALSFGFSFASLQTEARAQTPKAKPTEAQQSDPSVTTATYGDWVLRCVTAKADADKAPERLCEIVQTIQVKGQTVAQIALGRRAKAEALTMTAVLPVNIALPGKAFVAAEIVKDKAPEGVINLVWRHCLQGSCVAVAQLADKELKALLAASENGALGFVEASGRQIMIRLSWNGFSAALDALQQQ